MSGRELARARRKAMSSGGKIALKSGTNSQPAAPVAADTPQQPEPTPTAPRRRQGSAVAAAPATGGARSAALARRKALSSRGKIAVSSKDRVRGPETRSTPAPSASKTDTAGNSKACGCGCKSKTKAERETVSQEPVASERSRRGKSRRGNHTKVAMNPGRAASLARRRVQSTRGKAGLGAAGMSQAQAVRSTNPELSSREIARELRNQRSKRGGAGQKKSAPTGRQRPNRNKDKGPAEDQPWKVGSSETSHGQFVTGTMVGRDKDVTGDEASTCRAITGTEYLGADIFRDFCQTDAPKGVIRVGKSETVRGNAVTGNEVGRSRSVTGDEPGTCKNVTGTEYVGADQAQAYCGTAIEPGPAKVAGGETHKGNPVTGTLVLRSQSVTGNETGFDRQLTGTPYTQLGDDSAPEKVGASKTLRGGEVTGTMVGRRANMTGDEMGSCRNVTGDDYVGVEQYQNFCLSMPTPTDSKVKLSKTMAGETVTGTITGRAGRVTGDEPGTCKAVTGTPYAGAEQYSAFCQNPQIDMATARMQTSRRVLGAAMTGAQPSVGGNMTGDEKGACETVSGTPYIGADQQGAVCPAAPSEANSSDFPQPLGAQPWGKFSTTPPSHAAREGEQSNGVTGTGYDQGQITGPFGMAPGKVTGTEHARFGNTLERLTVPETKPQIDESVKSRVTGEGVDAGSKITGDDWDRGDRVTGTEGMSAKLRNPSRRGGPISAMAPLHVGSRNEELPVPVSKVTGGSGNTDKGSLITYSGGARG